MRTRELLPVTDAPGLRLLAGRLTCSGLRSWFNDLPESVHRTANVVVLPGQSDGSLYTVRRRGGYNYQNISLKFIPDDPTASRVNFMGYQDVIRVRSAHSMLLRPVDLDYLSQAKLAWRRQDVGRLDLIPVNQYTPHLAYEPYLVYVENAVSQVTPETAERAVAEAIGVMAVHTPKP